MDITLNELKTMKAKQLRRIIQEAIKEVLNEDSVVTKDTPPGKASIIAKAEQIQASDVVAAIKQAKQSGKPVTVIGKGMNEGELEEAKTYKITNPNFDTSIFANKSIKGTGTTVAGMLDWVKQQQQGVSAKQFQQKWNLPREQQANAFLNAFHKEGILTKLGSGGQEITVPQPGEAGEEDQPEAIDGPEAFLIGSGDLSKYFSAASNDNAGDEEDFNDEEEPTAGEIDGQPVSTSSMSNEDYEAFMKYDELKQRLDATKSNIIKMKRSKGGTAGDIKDVPSSEIERLQVLKKSLQDKIDALVASSDYLKKKTGQEVAPPEIKDIEDEETLEEYNDRMYEIRKLQYYAGIRK